MDNDVDTGPEPASDPSTSALRHENLNREHSPEPDLDLDLTRGTHQVWLVKVPKFLIDGWSRIQHDDVPLGHVRVYDPDENGNQPMELILPEYLHGLSLSKTLLSDRSLRICHASTT